MQSAGRIDVFRDLWNEWRSRSVRPYTTPEKISFPLDNTKLSHTRIVWPARSPWENARPFGGHLRVGLERFVAVEHADIPQPYPGLVLFQAQYKDRKFDLALDFRDYLDVVQEKALKQVTLYFKMQYRRTGYGALGRDAGKLIPGGYVPSASAIYFYIESLRSMADRSARTFDVYGRFGLRYSREIRQKAIDLLRAQNQFRYEGGGQRVRYSRTLAEMARSRVCIDLPGNGDFCMRLVDYFGIGACVIGPRHRTTLHVPLEDGKHIVYCKDDLSDLVSLCGYYLDNKEAQRAFRRNTRLYFDRFLHREQLAAYYLQHVLKFLG